MFQDLEKTEKIEMDTIVTVCAWCKRARVITGDLQIIWTHRYAVTDDQIISHTICPSCKEKMMAEEAALSAFA